MIKQSKRRLYTTERHETLNSAHHFMQTCVWESISGVVRQTQWGVLRAKLEIITLPDILCISGRLVLTEWGCSRKHSYTLASTSRVWPITAVSQDSISMEATWQVSAGACLASNGKIDRACAAGRPARLQPEFDNRI